LQNFLLSLAFRRIGPLNIKNPAIKRQGQNYVIDFFYLGVAGTVLFAGGGFCVGAGAA